MSRPGGGLGWTVLAAASLLAPTAVVIYAAGSTAADPTPDHQPAPVVHLAPESDRLMPGYTVRWASTSRSGIRVPLTVREGSNHGQ